MAYSKLGGADRATVSVTSTANNVVSSLPGNQTLQTQSASFQNQQNQAAGTLPPTNVSSTAPVVNQTTALQAAEKKMLESRADKGQQIKICNNSKINPLEAYASCNYLFTMFAASPGELASGGFRKPNPDLVIFSSAGRYDGNRVSTSHGKPEYFVENFKQTNVIAPNSKIGNTYSIKIEFEVFEPYSMGVFLQSLALTAFSKGYKNHLECPFVIKLDFVGWDDSGNLLPPPDNCAPRYFVIKLTNCEFTVSEAGSKYFVEAIPYNHFSYNDSVTLLKNDITFIVNDPDGTKDVKDALVDNKESLVNVLNTIETNQKDTERTGGTQLITYKIEFPIPNGGPDPDGNEISKAKFKYDVKDGGALVFPKADKVWDGGGNYIDLKKEKFPQDEKRKVHYAQGQNIISIITEVINASEWTKKQVVDTIESDSGFITYYKIDVQVTLDSFNTTLQEWEKTVTFKVRPYKVHSEIFGNTASNPVGYDTIKNKIVKEYHYLYTGKNVDVIDFDIKVNYLYYRGYTVQSDTKTTNVSNPGQQGAAKHKAMIYKVKTGSAPGTARASDAGLPSPNGGTDPSTYKNQNNGLGINTPENQIAQHFHRTFVDGASADMVNLELKILGDPYWLSDSGPGNYTVTIAGPDQETKDGTMNYESVDIFTWVEFRVPDDVDPESGNYKFSTTSGFSGIYRITQVENEFSEGLFTQTLTGVRMIGQALDFESGSASPGGIKQIEEKSEQPEPENTLQKKATA